MSGNTVEQRYTGEVAYTEYNVYDDMKARLWYKSVKFESKAAPATHQDIFKYQVTHISIPSIHSALHLVESIKFDLPSVQVGHVETRITLRRATQVYTSTEEKKDNSFAISLEEAKRLLETLKPKAVVELKPGEIKRVSEELIVEKTRDGRIIIYEVVEE